MICPHCHNESLSVLCWVDSADGRALEVQDTPTTIGSCPTCDEIHPPAGYTFDVDRKSRRPVLLRLSDRVIFQDWPEGVCMDCGGKGGEDRYDAGGPGWTCEQCDGIGSRPIAPAEVAA